MLNKIKEIIKIIFTFIAFIIREHINDTNQKRDSLALFSLKTNTKLNFFLIP